MKILEPTTVITDYILAAETMAFGILMLRSGGANTELSVRLWAFAFFATAVAAAAGGTFHGFVDAMGSLAPRVWKITVYAIGLTSFLMLSAALFASVSGPLRAALLVATFLQFFLYCIWMIRHDDFKYVIYDYVPAMVLILVLQIVEWSRGGSGWIVAGIVVSFAAAGIQQSGFSLHRHFNFNDIYHVIQMFAMYLLYRGGLLLRDS